MLTAWGLLTRRLLARGFPTLYIMARLIMALGPTSRRPMALRLSPRHLRPSVLRLDASCPSASRIKASCPDASGAWVSRPDASRSYFSRLIPSTQNVGSTHLAGSTVLDTTHGLDPAGALGSAHQRNSTCQGPLARDLNSARLVRLVTAFHSAHWLGSAHRLDTCSQPGTSARLILSARLSVSAQLRSWARLGSRVSRLDASLLCSRLQAVPERILDKLGCHGHVTGSFHTAT